MNTSRHKRTIELAVADAETAALAQLITTRNDSPIHELSIDSVESLARLNNLEALLAEAPSILPEFPHSLNLVVWAAFNISLDTFAKELEDYLQVNGFVNIFSINSLDTEEIRACKALATAVRLKLNALAFSMIESEMISIFPTTLEEAASLGMLSFLKQIVLKKVPLKFLNEPKPSLISAVRQSMNGKAACVSWDLIYNHIVTFCPQDEILTVLSWNHSIQHIISPLCAHGLFDLAISLIVKRQASLEVQETLEILESGKIKFLTKLSKTLRPNKPKFLYNSKISDCLSMLITKPPFLLDAIYLIRRIPLKYLTIQNLSHITRTLRSLLSLHNDNTLIEHWNPMLVAIVCTELCSKFANYQFEFKHSFDLMRVKFKSLANSYIKKFSEFRKVYLIYTDDSYPGGNLLDIMTNKSSEYRLMLESELVSAVVEHLWSGNAKEVMMHNASPLFHIFKSKHPNKIFHVHNSKKMEREVNCYFSYSAWKQSAEMRFWLETLYLIGVLIRVVITIRTFAQTTMIIYDWAEDPQKRLDATDKLRAEKLVMWLCFGYFLAFQIRIVYMWVFQRLNHQKIKPDIKNAIDVCLFCFMAMVIDRVENHPEEVEDQEDLFAIIMLLICIKCAMIMLITKHFGPVVRAIGIIVVKAFKYIILFLLSVVAFSLVFYVLFYRQNEKFETIGKSFTVLFDFSSGNLDFDVFGDRRDLGAVLVCVWTFVSMITLLNIIVAFITNRYSSMEPEANADYASLLYTNYKATIYNESFNALVMFPVPTNILIVFLSPLYWLIPNSKNINRVLMAVSYVQMLILALCIFTVYNIIMIPIAYIKTIFRIISFLRNERSYSLTLVKWIFLGPFYMLFLCAISYRYVLKLLLTNKIRQKQYELSNEMLEETIRLTERLAKDQEEPVIVPLNFVLQTLMESDQEKQVKGFFESLRGLNRKMTTRASLFKNVIKDYHLCNQVEFIEQFLWIDEDLSQQMVNLTLLRKMIQELAFNSTRLIPINVSGIQRALMKFKKSSSS